MAMLNNQRVYGSVEKYRTTLALPSILPVFPQIFGSPLSKRFSQNLDAYITRQNPSGCLGMNLWWAVVHSRSGQGWWCLLKILAIWKIIIKFWLELFWMIMQVKPPQFWDCSTYTKKTTTMCFVVTMATSFIARVVWVQHFPAMTTTRSQDSSTIPADSADSQLIKAWNEHVLQISSHFYRITFIYVSS